MIKKITDEELMSIISKEELYNLYVIQNKNRNEVCKLLNISTVILDKLLHKYNIEKAKEHYFTITKEQLYQDYIIDNMKLKDVAKKYNVCMGCVIEKLAKFSIKKDRALIIKNNSKYTNINPNQLRELYINKNMAASEISKILGISPTHIQRLLKKFNIIKTPEQFKEMQIRISNEIYARRTEEQRQHKVEACKKIWHNMTEEQRKERLIIFSKINSNRSAEHRAKLKASFKRYIANETPEQKAERIRKVSEGTKKAIANMSEEKKRKIVNNREEALKRNGTFRSSMPEFIVGLLLKNKFTEVNYQYKSKEYPYKCDFYIPEINTWIEYQGNPGHGKEPFDETNSEHIKLVNEWKERADKKEKELQRKSKYSQFIYIWTNLDVKKRKTAKENNLNLLEFFNMNQFLDWYRTQNGTLLLEYKSSIK